MKEIRKRLDRIARVLDHRTGPATGVREIEPGKIERWWAEWDGTSTLTAGRPGVALVAVALTLEQWEAKHGPSIEIDTSENE